MRHSEGNSCTEGRGITSNSSGVYVTGEYEGLMFSLSDAAGDIISLLLNTYAGLNDIFIASYTIDGLHH